MLCGNWLSRGRRVRILKDVGEVGIHAGERDVVLRPSLYAMSELGDPREIVELFGQLMNDPVTEGDARMVILNACTVLTLCTDEDISELTGHMGENGFEPGSIPVVEMVILARSLMRHGVVGALPPQESRGDQPDYVSEFDARGFVAAAMAHLGVSESEAWNMTMTSLVGALRSKYPPVASDTPGARAPTKAEHEATMEWADKVDAARRARGY